jgi:hypothetical protein
LGWRERERKRRTYCCCSSAAEAGRIEGPTERSRRGQKLGLEGERAKKARLLLLLFCGRSGQKLGLEGARAKEAHLLLLLFCG